MSQPKSFYITPLAHIEMLEKLPNFRGFTAPLQCETGFKISNDLQRFLKDFLKLVTEYLRAGNPLLISLMKCLHWIKEF